MKVIQINSVYGKGSTGVLTKQIHEGLLANGVESMVVYGRGNTTDAKGAYRLCTEQYAKANSFLSRISGLSYGGCLLSTERMKSFLIREHPDVVHLQCANEHFVNLYRLLRFLKTERIPTVITLHAEFMFTANCPFAYSCEKWKNGCIRCTEYSKRKQYRPPNTERSWKLFEDAYSDFGHLNVVCISPWQRRRAEASPFFSSASFSTILNGVDCTVFHPYPSASKEKKQILHVSSQFDLNSGHRKGGEYVFALAERLSEEAEFTVVGPTDVKKIPHNVKMLGPVYDREQLARLYSAADMTLLTSRQETFSMVCAESLCCGTPAVGFHAGGPESIALREYSSFCPYGDLDALEALARNMGRKKEQKAIAECARKAYSVDRMIKEYVNLYREVR